MIKYVFPIMLEFYPPELKEVNKLLKEVGGAIKSQEELVAVPIEVPEKMTDLQIKTAKAMLGGVLDVAVAEATKHAPKPEGARAYVGDPRIEE